MSRPVILIWKHIIDVNDGEVSYVVDFKLMRENAESFSDGDQLSCIETSCKNDQESKKEAITKITADIYKRTEAYKKEYKNCCVVTLGDVF